MFASGPGQCGGGGWKSLGVSESSLPVLKEEGLKDGVLSLEAFFPGW